MTFWVKSSSGPGVQTINWDTQAGDWTAVVMNADGSPGFNAAAVAGVSSDLVPIIGWSLVGGGLLVAGTGAGLTAVGAHRSGRGPSGPSSPYGPATESSGARPLSPDGAGVPGRGAVRVQAVYDPAPSRWLWLIKWLLVIPHAILLGFLWIAVFIISIVAAVAILFTGRYPRGLYEFTLGVLRWQWRVAFYALTLGTDRYPPFSLDEEPDYPARLDIDYPQHLSHWLWLVKWLLAIPHLIIVGILGAMAWTTAWNVTWTTADTRYGGGIGLTGLLALIAGIVLLFSGRYPQPFFDLIVGFQRWTLRVAAYMLLMRDEYPPFRLDQGGGEPSAEPAGPPPTQPPPVSAERDDALAGT
jgi:hypothetical protein